MLTDNESIVVLSDGLKARNNECMRNLAFFDLYCMTEQVEKRVEDLFKIRLKGKTFGLLFYFISTQETRT